MKRRAFLTFASTTPTQLSSLPLAAWAPNNGEEWDYPTAAHLLRRTLTGPTDVEIRRAVDEGLDRTLQRLFTTFEPDWSELSDFVGHDPLTSYGYTPDEPEWWVIFYRYREWMHHLTRWYLKTQIGDQTSLQEKMTFFWHSHFAMELDNVCWPELMYEAINTLRADCFGNVRELAWKITIDLGMLQYLDGGVNRCFATWREINENYARELLELFTVGIYDRDGNPNYTQDDVAAAAHSLTGWMFAPSALGPLYSQLRSRFLEEAWDPSDKTFLGRTGPWNARNIIDIIFEERAEDVSWNIASKLYEFFVSAEHDNAVIDAMARMLRDNNWEVRPVVETLLRSAHFLGRAMHGGMVRPLADYFLGTIRTMGVTDVPDFHPDAKERTHSDLFRRLRTLGQLPLNPPNVKAWPGGRRWLSATTMSERIFWADRVVRRAMRDANGAESYSFDAIAFASSFPNPNDARELVDDIVRLLLPAQIDEAERAGLLAELLDNGPIYEWSIDSPEQNPDARIRKLLGAIVSHPNFQLT
ncbi:MAG: DUF1800 family protein [bacterium]|nr:DUF1800 family protein [Candidatus Kapabacteria bacterium]